MIEQLIAAAREGVEDRRAETPQADLVIEGFRPRRRPTLQRGAGRPGLSVIAEFKRRSPSAGEISESATRRRAGRRLRACGRRGGPLRAHRRAPLRRPRSSDLRAARAACSLPILRKDFLVDPYQLFEAAVNGADAVLLIVRALDDAELRSLYETARGLDLDCLVEVHDGEELERALRLDADVIGINNRNLDQGTVEIATTYELMPDVPAGKTVVAESGISARAELEELERVGVDAVLIGSALMGAADPEALTRELTGADEGTREHHLP
jgi:indole-3-glycerol phosphate synthase